MPPKGYTKKVRARQVETNEKRCYLIRKCLAQGFYITEIVDTCRKSRYFRKEECFKKSGRWTKGDDILSRKNIEKWISKVKKDLRLNKFNSTDEIVEAYERLLLAYRKACTHEDTKGMVLAQREINRMLGLRRMPTAEAVDPDELQNQIQEMQSSIPEWEDD